MKNFTLVLIGSLFAVGAAAQGDERPEVSGLPRTSPGFISLSVPPPANQASALVTKLGGANPAVAFASVAKEVDEVGMTHESFQQTYQGIPVDGYVYTAHSKGGEVETITGLHAEIPFGLDAKPSLAPGSALEGALSQLSLSEPMWESADAPADYAKPAGELVVYADAETREAALAYKFDVYTQAPLYRAFVYVDAKSGEVLFENSRIHHADQPVQARSSYNGTVGITVGNNGGTLRLRQATLGGGVETFSCNNGTSYARATDVTDNGTPFDTDPTAIQAHYGAEQTYDYFRREHNRRSYNNRDAKLISYVHYNRNYVNAFWDGTRMTYGDGDGRSYGALVALDIAGHELTHGVTEYAAGLIYRNESGALNESFSDIFGEMVEFHATGQNNWRMGSDIGINRDGALRSMNDPNRYGDPDTYGGTNYYRGSADNGGVHINSGVQNKWFYILATGERGTNDLGNAYDVRALGRTKAAAIAYRNLEVYLSANSTYRDARAGAIQAAIDLYGAGSAEVIATTNAWYAVGVGAAYEGGGGDDPGTPPGNPGDGDGSTKDLLASYFETGNDGWVSGGGDAGRVRSSRSYEGDYSFLIRDNSGAASSMITARGYDLRGARSAELKLYFQASQMENGEDFLVEYNAGSSWQTAARYVTGTDFNNGTYYSATVALSPNDFSFTSNAKFRIRCDASVDNDAVYVDQVTIKYIGASGSFVAENAVSGQDIEAAERSVGGQGILDDQEVAVRLAPNPAHDYFEIVASPSSPVQSAVVYESTGRVVRELSPDELGGVIDISTLPAGMYLIGISTGENETEVHRFVKQ